jgi:hypothetical protein
MDLNNKVHGERLIQDTTANPKSRGALLPSHGGELCGGVGEGGEVAGGNSATGPLSNLPLTMAYNLFVSLFSISASVCCKIKSQGVYISIFTSNLRQRHED